MIVLKKGSVSYCKKKKKKKNGDFQDVEGQKPAPYKHIWSQVWMEL